MRIRRDNAPINDKVEMKDNNADMITYKKGSAATVVVAAVVGLLIGWGVAASMKGAPATNEATTGAPMTDTKAAGLRVLLNAIEREHVHLAATAVRNGFDGSADFQASANQLDANSKALADAVASIYGKEAGDQFLTIWRSHIGFFVDYTLAAKKGDKAGMDKAVQNLGGYADAISDLLSQATAGGLPRDAVKELVMTHVGLLKEAVDKYGAKDYAGSYAKQHEAADQIGTIADAISGAIVKQFPEKF